MSANHQVQIRPEAGAANNPLCYGTGSNGTAQFQSSATYANKGTKQRVGIAASTLSQSIAYTALIFTGFICGIVVIPIIFIIADSDLLPFSYVYCGSLPVALVYFIASTLLAYRATRVLSISMAALGFVLPVVEANLLFFVCGFPMLAFPDGTWYGYPIALSFPAIVLGILFTVRAHNLRN